MSNYFSYFPTTQHDLTNIGQNVELTNIIRRFKIKNSLSTDTRVYEDYDIQAGERPDTVADKFYNNPNYAWLILLFNDIDDPVFGWPLFNNDFDNFIIGKYGSIASAQGTVHEYRKVLNPKSVKFDGRIVEKRTVTIDLTTYNTLGASLRESISQYDYEEEVNENKRQIKILHERYLTNVSKQVKGILKDGV
jgi:hypothetical protein